MAPKVTFSCTFCNKSYNIKGSLANHMRQKHKIQQSARAMESLNMAKVRKELSKEMEVLQKVAENLDMEEQLDVDEEIMVAAAEELGPASLTELREASDEVVPEVVAEEPKRKVVPPPQWMAKTWSGLGNLLEYATNEMPGVNGKVNESESCGECESKDGLISTLESRIGKVVDERLKMQGMLNDLKREAKEKDTELEERKETIAQQKREILRLKEELKKRENLEVVVQSEVFKCDLCDFKSTRKVTIKAHKDVAHVGLLHKCDFCGKVCRGEEALKEHLDVVHKHPTFECTNCDFQTRCRKEGERHVMTHNEKIVEEKMPCNKCNYEAINEDDLRAHVIRTHPGVLQSKRPCRYWKEKRCNKGESCRFSHRGPQGSGPASAPAGAPRCRNGADCRFLARGNCHFSHPREGNSNGKQDQGRQEESRKCWYQEDCRRQQCSFVHEKAGNFGNRKTTAVPNVRMKNSKYNY